MLLHGVNCQCVSCDCPSYGSMADPNQIEWQNQLQAMTKELKKDEQKIEADLKKADEDRDIMVRGGAGFVAWMLARHLAPKNHAIHLLSAAAGAYLIPNVIQMQEDLMKKNPHLMQQRIEAERQKILKKNLDKMDQAKKQRIKEGKLVKQAIV